MTDLREPHVGLWIFPVGNDAAVGDPPDELLHHRMIGAHHGQSRRTARLSTKILKRLLRTASNV